MVARVLFPVLTWRGYALTPPAPGDHQGPPVPTSSALAPTDIEVAMVYLYQDVYLCQQHSLL